MESIKINNFQDYLNYVASIKELGPEIVLFRGQSSKQPLCPSVARKNPSFNSTNVEKKMLEELKRRTQLILNHKLKDDWDWLIFAQHFGMMTRLLDWTSNPLTGLWFACSSEYNIDNDGYLYILKANKELQLNRSDDTSPFDDSKTKIIRPSLNNERIIAQSGWFTVHKYSQKTKSFVPLENNKDVREFLTEIKIPRIAKRDILDKLSVFGINYQSLFPDVTGVCNHMNWMFGKDIK